MSTTTRRCCCLPAILALAVGAGVAQAQAPPASLNPEDLAGKQLARALLDARPADSGALARARRDAVQVELDARWSEFLAGRGTPDLLQQAARHWREAERSLHEILADQAAVLEQYWEITREMEEVTRARVEAGRVSTKEYLECRCDRLEAAIRLRELRDGSGKALPLLGGSAYFPGGTGGRAVPAKQLAKAKLELTRADVRELARSRAADAADACQARLQNFIAGFVSLDVLLERLRLWLLAELALCDDPADRRAAYERHWELVYQIDEVYAQRYEAGRVAVPDREQSRYFRLEAEQWLREAQKGSGKPVGLSQRPLTFPTWATGPDVRAIARAKFAVMRADPQQLARAKLAAAEAESAARWKEFLAGRGVQDILLGALRRRLDSQLTLTEQAAARRAAHEAYWRRLLQVEEVDRVRYENARIAIQDYMQARFARLEAELRLARARAKP